MNTARDFKDKISRDGLWAAMRWLNANVPYRYSAIFAFRGDTLHNLCLVDKQDPTITSCADQQISDSYCIYIHRTGTGFAVENARLDPRVEDHPKRFSYQCYYGIPLIGSDGKLLGTVCHFDAAPVQVTQGVVEVLDDLAPIIVESAFEKIV